MVSFLITFIFSIIITYFLVKFSDIISEETRVTTVTTKIHEDGTKTIVEETRY